MIDKKLQSELGKSPRMNLIHKQHNPDISKIIEININQFLYISLKLSHILLEDIAIIVVQEIVIVFMQQTIKKLLFS